MKFFRDSSSRRPRLVAYGCLLVYSAVVLSGCEEAESTKADSNKTTQAHPDDIAEVSSGGNRAAGANETALAAVQLGPGFRYDPDDRIKGYEEWVTIRLGNALRIYYRGEWRPATLTLLDDQNNVVDSLRLDLPSVGAISGSLPKTTSQSAKARLVFAAGGLTKRKWDRRIGIQAPELSWETLNSLNELAQNAGLKNSNSTSIASHEASLDRTFGSIHIVACDADEIEAGVDSTSTYTGNFVADHLLAEEGEISDEAWLPRRVRNVFDELRKTSRLSKADATEQSANLPE